MSDEFPTPSTPIQVEENSAVCEGCTVGTTHFALAPVNWVPFAASKYPDQFVDSSVCTVPGACGLRPPTMWAGSEWGWTSPIGRRALHPNSEGRAGTVAASL